MIYKAILNGEFIVRGELVERVDPPVSDGDASQVDEWVLLLHQIFGENGNKMTA